MEAQRIIVGLATVATLLVLVTLASAQDRKAWFKSLRMPGSGISCCDVSDCKQTDAVWQGGGWWARSNVSGKVVAIPPAKVLQLPHSIDGEAYLCEGPASATIFCFIPPSPGS